MPKLPEKTSESLHRALLDLLPVAAAVVDSTGHVYDANGAFAKAFGFDLAERSSRELSEILSPTSSAWIFLNDQISDAHYSNGPLRFTLKIARGEEAVKLDLEITRLDPSAARDERQWFLLAVKADAQGALQAAPAPVSENDEFAVQFAEIKRCPPALVILVEKALGDFVGRINSVMKARDLRLLLSQLHGLKGTSLMVGLKSIGTRVHALESLLARAEAKFMDGEFDREIAELTSGLAETRRLLGVMHDRAKIEGGHESSDEVYNSIQRLFTKYDQLISSRPNWGARIAAERIDWAIRSANRAPVTELGEFFRNQVKTAAETAGKLVKTEWQSDAMPIDEDSRKILVEVFTHIATNSVAHGIESPSEREARGKPGQGTVRAFIRYDGSVIEGSIIDDGAGIDAKAIRKRAFEKGTRPPEVLHSMNDAEILDLIFDAGFSTKDEVDKLSGRGVGLDAVRLALQRSDGEIQVRSLAGQGTEFHFKFRPPTNRPSSRKILTYRAIHNELMGVIGYQAEHEGLAVRLAGEMVNGSRLETGLVYADDVRMMTAVSGVIGRLAADSVCEVTMSVDADGGVRLRVDRKPLAKAIELPEQYALLKDSFALWIRLNGGSVREESGRRVEILIGGALKAEELPVLELRSAADLGLDDYSSVLKAVRAAGSAMGFQILDPAASSAARPKLVLLAAYANYAESPGEIAIRYQQHPAEIKSVLIAAMEKVLRAS